MGSASHTGFKIDDRERLYKKPTTLIDYAEKDERKTESGNHEMISRKITYPLSDFLSRSTVTKIPKKINGVE